MTEYQPALRIRFSKRTDGSVVLHCVRRDGTSTWQRQSARSSKFFVAHDLRHFAVETTLGIHHGFFGLIADGWSIADTEGKGPRGSPPADALLAEQLVGLLDRERLGGSAPLGASEVKAHLAMPPASMRGAILDELTDGQLDRIRALAAELHARWAATESDMELEFDRAPLRQNTRDA